MKHAFGWTTLALAACTSGPGAVTLGEAGVESVPVARECTVPGAPDPATLNLARDLAYAGTGDEAQRLDIAWPKRPGPHPLVVLIHGGGWYEGHRSGYHPLMRLLAGQGYAVASVGYRLAAAPRNTFPAAVADVRCAVRWLRANAERFSVDPARVAAMGISAGGHLSAMLGTAADVEGLDGDCPLRGISPAVSAVVSFAGPMDIRTAGALDDRQRRMVENFLGTEIEADMPRALLASPGVHVTAAAPPFLLVHGTADDLVDVRQSRSMLELLRSAGVRATLLELPGEGHYLDEISADPRYRASTCTTLEFLRRELRPGS